MQIAAAPGRQARVRRGAGRAGAGEPRGNRGGLGRAGAGFRAAASSAKAGAWTNGGERERMAMAWRVFIDGEAGTTGLQIRERLAGRGDIALVAIDAERRKDPEARLAAYRGADMAILCLPDEAVKEIAPEAARTGTRLIDASSAHRTDPDWAFGFAELSPGHRAAIAGAARVSNPGCYASGAIAMLYPLVQAGLVAPDEPLSLNAVSGYSGGGKSLIAEMESGAAGNFFVYAMGQKHKHVPEIMARSGLSRRPVFVPSVGRYAQGMIVQMPLHLDGRGTPADLRAALAAHYADARFVAVAADDAAARIDPERLNGSNRLELSVHGSAETGVAVVIAVLDNLGKGASGAAVQNLNIMLGLDEGTGL